MEVSAMVKAEKHFAFISHSAPVNSGTYTLGSHSENPQAKGKTA